ncbi:PepSY-associated TM helix domain-containing protein [Wolinella succinogenes]|uniref:PepSY domain-containing protein n=1 Tax=Wolinella succinogenes (strain ATCC 29543 / DSM 1740 / CCUG 13145 / JCM 31913 / LMG 7466 / NCTC 11488 / FDC 602W) TaxID=273121 RepID=Q7MRE8_WOLSU|nr:PepSY-associated TM helix domain-containing protein [Wolinella succinogenes]CAE10474.1 conserved hypothetical protein [Wolinella succinogenes]VEG80617.1 Uncharacterized iron-regulated membrane protein [Wolinella succinogenes]HCZ19687.1 hypothetical protein [Helicobacter sp.]
MRRFFLWIHKWLGLLSTIFLVIAALSGSIIAFTDEIDRWLNPKLFSIDSSKEGVALKSSEWIAKVKERFPQAHINSYHLPQKSSDSILAGVKFGKGAPEPWSDYNQLFIDPRDGEVLGGRNTMRCCSQESIIPYLYRFHYTLGLPDRYGVWLMGGVAILWLFITLSGVWLSTPNLFKEGFWHRFKPSWKIKWGAKRYRWFLDTHRALGMWLLLPLFLLALSSVALNLRNELFRPVVGLFSPLTPLPFEALKRYPPDPKFRPKVEFDEALERARVALAGEGIELEPRSIFYLGGFRSYMVLFGPKHPLGYGTPRIVIHAESGEYVSRYIPGRGSVGDRFTHLQFPLHSGQIAGIGGRIFVAILGLVITWACISGLYLWWKKNPFSRISLFNLKFKKEQS